MAGHKLVVTLYIILILHLVYVGSVCAMETEVRRTPQSASSSGLCTAERKCAKIGKILGREGGEVLVDGFQVIPDKRTPKMIKQSFVRRVLFEAPHISGMRLIQYFSMQGNSLLTDNPDKMLRQYAASIPACKENHKGSSNLASSTAQMYFFQMFSSYEACIEGLRDKIARDAPLKEINGQSGVKHKVGKDLSNFVRAPLPMLRFFDECISWFDQGKGKGKGFIRIVSAHHMDVCLTNSIIISEGFNKKCASKSLAAQEAVKSTCGVLFGSILGPVVDGAKCVGALADIESARQCIKSHRDAISEELRKAKIDGVNVKEAVARHFKADCCRMIDDAVSVNL